jgi:hypothetical protein
VTLDGLNELQQQIATLLWGAQTEDEYDAVLLRFGQDAELVRDLMILAALDEELEYGSCEGDWIIP